MLFKSKIHSKHRKSIKKMFREKKKDTAGENVWPHPERDALGFLFCFTVLADFASVTLALSHMNLSI